MVMWKSQATLTLDKDLQAIRNPESWRNSLAWRRSSLLVIQDQAVSSENTHTRNILWTKQVIFTYLEYIYQQLKEKEAMNLRELRKVYGRDWKVERRGGKDLILISKKFYYKKIQQSNVLQVSSVLRESRDKMVRERADSS